MELIVILAALAIIAAIAVARFFDFNDKAIEELLNAAIAELNNREKFAFIDTKKSQYEWINDQILFSQVNPDMRSG